MLRVTKVTYHAGSMSTFCPLKLKILGAWANKAPDPSNISAQELNRTSPRMFTTGVSRFAQLTMESIVWTLCWTNKSIM